jgi:hypothetical protein
MELRALTAMQYPSYDLSRKQSPIMGFVARFEAVHAFASTRGDADMTGSNVLAWIIMLLLPIAIALRLVKTSLELFGAASINDR